MIIGNGPVPDNPFCHGAAANRYGLMSSGTGDKVGSSVTDYFKKMQPRRDSWIWIVDTTDEQEKCMINKAKDIEKALDNCFSRTNQIFEACGYSNPVMNTNSPTSIQVYKYSASFMVLINTFLQKGHSRNSHLNFKERVNEHL